MEEFFAYILKILPALITGLGVWRIQVIIGRAENRRKDADECREKLQIILLKSINAAICLGEATATAIKNGKANGEVSDAVKYATQIKHEQRDFLHEQGIKKII